ncbi:MAG TPA: ribosome biogenesis GTP-binding protein YihA/YsxC [Candidatus Deferrimicrobium sp.]|nr:ribosome biogenesis GTP-binding protein YihA/YsxC [Candidatus Deferrimicrobium sp.]
MKISSSEFIISAVGPKQYPETGLPEVALVGRSNVGKSSLINCFLNRNNFARTSSRPGKTGQLNYYLINNAFYFVDLPGYGFAQVSKDVKAQWGKMIEAYLNNRREIRAVIQLVDMRHPPSADDETMHNWLMSKNIPTLVVATKADKISRGQWQKHLKAIKEGLDLPGMDVILPFSAETRGGRDELHELVGDIVGVNQSEPVGD